MSQYGENIDWLVDSGFAGDLLNILIGQNEYADLNAFEKLDIYSRQLRRMAIRHLEFIIEHRNKTDTVTVNGQILSPYPEYFAAWKLAGCPGISLHQLDRMVKSKHSSLAE
ncbi:hypothetical protein [Rhizobium rhizogenes]|uniref:hypothetical protein n=1 Tax=Rhizobium rhizogenes TaxID=359 RepID=UPI001571A329|nr:hypothetical protein [Rhizobium rhizogenes]NTI78412.1 hypothetical protein [Rhizobium rhizogenes]